MLRPDPLRSVRDLPAAVCDGPPEYAALLQSLRKQCDTHTHTPTHARALANTHECVQHHVLSKDPLHPLQSVGVGVRVCIPVNVMSLSRRGRRGLHGRPQASTASAAAGVSMPAPSAAAPTCPPSTYAIQPHPLTTVSAPRLVTKAHRRRSWTGIGTDEAADVASLAAFKEQLLAVAQSRPLPDDVTYSEILKGLHVKAREVDLQCMSRNGVGNGMGRRGDERVGDDVGGNGMRCASASASVPNKRPGHVVAGVGSRMNGEATRGVIMSALPHHDASLRVRLPGLASGSTYEVRWAVLWESGVSAWSPGVVVVTDIG